MLQRIPKPALYVAIAVVQLLICIPGFLVFFRFPMGVMFCGYGDGLKNMFTLVSYVQEPIGDGGIFKYNSFCYPFGDYVYFTDNMPLFSIPFRFFCQYIYNISAYTTLAFNTFVIGNIVICGLLVFAVFSRILRNNAWAILMAIALPWTNMQLQRIARGHFSLSFTALVLAAFYLLILWQQYSGQRKKQFWVGAAMCVLSLLSFLAHGYLFAIVTLFTTFALLFYSLFTWQSKEMFFNLSAALVYPISATGLVLMVVNLTDKYLTLRKDNAMGYDSMDQKVRFSALFSHYKFNTVYFPFSTSEITNDPEKAAYLGNMGLYSLAAIICAAMCSVVARRAISNIHTEYLKDPLRKALLFSGFVLLSVSVGEVYYTNLRLEDGYKLLNITNPFFYLHLFTKRVEQFRCLERFIYPFYFSFYIWVSYMLIQLLARVTAFVRVVLLSVLIFLGGIEVKDNVTRMYAATDTENTLNDANLKKIKLPAVDMARYQAILPIPYYCVGSEDYDYTVDVDGDWFLYTTQLSLSTGLPLMSYVLSRIPPAHNKALINCVANDEMDNGFRKMFSSKPVLVSVNKRLIADSNNIAIPSNETAAGLYKNACLFAVRSHLTPIDSVGEVVYYEWYPNPAKVNGAE